MPLWELNFKLILLPETEVEGHFRHLTKQANHGPVLGQNGALMEGKIIDTLWATETAGNEI